MREILDDNNIIEIANCFTEYEEIITCFLLFYFLIIKKAMQNYWILAGEFQSIANFEKLLSIGKELESKLN